MKFAASFITALLVADKALAFVPHGVPSYTKARTSKLHMAMDLPPAAPATELPVIQQNSYGQPNDVRYSDFLKLVNGDRVEKVTFSADGTQLLGVDVDGARLKIESLPNDPDLLTQLTNHKVCRNHARLMRCYSRQSKHISLRSLSIHFTGRRDGPSSSRGQRTWRTRPELDLPSCSFCRSLLFEPTRRRYRHGWSRKSHGLWKVQG
jgi:hypothetical protein